MKKLPSDPQLIAIFLTIAGIIVAIIVPYHISFTELQAGRESGKNITISLISSPGLALIRNDGGGTLSFKARKAPKNSEMIMEVVFENRGFLTINPDKQTESVVISFPPETEVIKTRVCTPTSLDKKTLLGASESTVVLSGFVLNPNNRVVVEMIAKNDKFIMASPVITVSSFLADTPIKHQYWPTSQMAVPNATIITLIILAVIILVITLSQTRNNTQDGVHFTGVILILIVGTALIVFFYQRSPTPLCS